MPVAGFSVFSEFVEFVLILTFASFIVRQYIRLLANDCETSPV